MSYIIKSSNIRRCSSELGSFNLRVSVRYDGVHVSLHFVTLMFRLYCDLYGLGCFVSPTTCRQKGLSVEYLTIFILILEMIEMSG